MDEQELNQHLSKITTVWSVVFQAHRDSADAGARARGQLLERYSGAVYRYLLGALRDPDVADDLFQEFALRVVRGDFKRADPHRGRFRDFVKTALFHLIVDHQKRQRTRPRPLAPDRPDRSAGAPAVADPDEEFLRRWREELLRRAWEALAAFQENAGKPFHTVLRFRVDHPDVPSPQLAAELGARLGRTFTAEGVRQVLHRAREKFAALLLAEVEHSLQTHDADRVEQELLDLGLFSYCRSAWQRRQRPG